MSNNAVVCSYKTFMQITGYSRPTIGRAIKLLKSSSFIDTVKVGSATAYCVNEKVAWQTSGHLRKYALFSATVIASDFEQEDPENLPSFEDNLKLLKVPFVSQKQEVQSEIDFDQNTGEIFD